VKKMKVHPLKIWLIEKGITQRKFSEEVGITQAALSSILMWRTEPTLQTAYKIIRATNNELEIESFLKTA
jgi:transcriptional regulator with XRE-family HTH domain